MGDEAVFDLVTEPWLPCLMSAGSLTELSLRDSFLHAHEVRRLGGETVTQPVALLRLMLAILHRSIGPGAGPPSALWRELWLRGRFDIRPIEDHLAAHRDRFDLLHPRMPFYQVADLHTAKGGFSPLSRLIVDVPAGAQFFTTRAAPSYASMSCAEAARWVVHAQAFDPSGIKSGAVGDDRVRGGKGYPIGIAWAGNLGLAVLEGASLFETLMFNFAPRAVPRSGSRDSVMWERAPLGASAEDRDGPVGIADLLTWQSRRIRLEHSSGRVTGVLLCNGDPLHPRNQQDHELMTAWRRSEAQEKSTGLDRVLMPRTHQPGRQVWRGLSGLLAVAPSGRPDEQGVEVGTLGWLAQLHDEGALAPEQVVLARAVGLRYGSNNSVVDDDCDDLLRLPAAVLARPEHKLAAVNAVADADNAVRALADLSSNLVQAAGGDPDGARERARETAYSALDQPFRDWLASLTAHAHVMEARERWQRHVESEIARLARDQMAFAGDVAWVGRDVPSGSSTRLMNTSIAERYFWLALRRALTLIDRREVGEEVHR